MKRRLIERTLPLLLLAAALAGYNLRLGSYQNFHPDETSWIFAGKLYTDLFFAERDFTHPMWSDQLGTWGSLNPTAGKFLIGTSLNLFGRLPAFAPPPRSQWPRAAEQGISPEVLTIDRLERELGMRRRYALEGDLQANRADLRVPTPERLAAARRLPVLLAVLGAAALWAIACRLWGGCVGLATLALYLSNPMVIRSSRQAMLDMPAVALGLIALWATLHVCRSGATRRAAVGWSLLAGTVWGLGVATKFNMLVPWIATFTAMVFWTALRWKSDPAARWRGAAALLALAVIPPALFIALNPFLYIDCFAPYGRHATKLGFMLHLGKLVAGYETGSQLPTLGGRIVAACAFLGGDAVWLRAVLGAWFGWLVGGVFIVCLAALLRSVFARDSTQDQRAQCMIFMGVQLAACAAIVAWIPQNWDRLFLPLIPLFCLALGFGLGRLCARLSQTRNNAPAASPSASLP